MDTQGHKLMQRDSSFRNSVCDSVRTHKYKKRLKLANLDRCQCTACIGFDNTARIIRVSGHGEITKVYHAVVEAEYILFLSISESVDLNLMFIRKSPIKSFLLPIAALQYAVMRVTDISVA